MDILDELENRVIPADGAMGTLLLESGVPFERCLEELCLSDPGRISGIHSEYIRAGARLIETNSFGANAVRLQKYGLEGRVREINGAAVQLARNAVGSQPIYVAGSVGPLGISKDEAELRGIDRQSVFSEQISALLDAGVDLILFETFLHLDEILEALQVLRSLHQGPAICSMACSEEGRLPSGIPVVDALSALRAQGADIVGVNCINGPRAMVRLFEQIPPEGPLCAFPNAGKPKFHDGRFLYFTSPDYFAEAAMNLASRGANLIGGCCGLGPKHIAVLVQALAHTRPGRSMPVPLSVPATPLPTAPSSLDEPSILEKIAQGKVVVVTELDTPKTLELDSYLAAAKTLVEAGADAITLADNSLAILRMSNLAVGSILKQRFGITPLLHLSCRDRNLLGLQSDLMGMDALGIRHVLPLTGDPAKGGDHPGASSVYDINSVELIKVIARMNEGYNAIGKSLRRSARFVIGCTLNPGARNLDAQIERLERKVAAGAQYVMTQPVFDTDLVRKMYERTKQIGVPILPGVWPLLSSRQAEFLHNEVPGMIVPDAIRARFHGTKGETGRELGVKIAKDVCRAVLDFFPGLYLITPVLRYELTAELTRFVRTTCS